MTIADNIILDIIRYNRKATADEIDLITTFAARAPFATYLAGVPGNLRKLLASKDIHVPAKLPGIEWHLLKRIYDEEQWHVETSIEKYVEDLHQAIKHPDAAVWTYRYFDKPCAGFLAPSHIRDVPKPLQYIYVAYDPRFGTITTGYQASGLDTIIDYHWTEVVRHR